MAILKFDNKAAYDAATKSTTESSVSLIKDSESVVYDNVNVIVSVPEVGDILFLDANNERHFLKHDTYNSASFPSGCTFVGVVFDVQGNTAGFRRPCVCCNAVQEHFVRNIYLQRSNTIRLRNTA